MQTDPTPEETTSRDDSQDLRRLVKRTLIGLVGLIVVLGILSVTLREPIIALSKSFVATLGGPGIGAGIFLADGLLFPIIHDALTGFGVLGELPFLEVLAWASVGSLSGGSLGFFIGRRLSHTKTISTILEKRASRVREIVEKHGALAVAIGAVTPLPYSLVTWTCGALGMNFTRFFLLSLLRIPRFAFYMWLIQLGFVTAPGSPAS